MSDPAETILVAIMAAVVGALTLGLTLLLLYGVYWMLTLPMRRAERARLFLDLIDLGVRQGLSPEQTVIGSSWSRDSALGVRFHLLAAELEQGLSLGEALRRVPRLLSPEVAEMLRTGERVGDVVRVLPACRQQLADGLSHVRGALNYVIVLTLATLPALFIGPLFFVKIWPKYQEVFSGMDADFTMPAFTRLVLTDPGLVLQAQAAVVALVLVLTFFYIAGPRFRSWVEQVVPGLPDLLSWALPWRRARLRRDFSAMLAILLDSRVPEPEAVRLAADCTGNAVIKRGAARACGLLERGVALPEAIRAVDASREFQWRLANALRGGAAFFNALRGWFESLDARAFRSEQTAAQVCTTLIVLWNGLVIGSIVVAVFLCLIALTERAVLW